MLSSANHDTYVSSGVTLTPLHNGFNIRQQEAGGTVLSDIQQIGSHDLLGASQDRSLAPFKEAISWEKAPCNGLFGADADWLHPAEPSPTLAEDELTGIENGIPLLDPDQLTAQDLSFGLYGRLETSDAFNPTRPGRYKDDYWLRSSTGNQVQIDMMSSELDAYLQIINPQTGQVIAFDDDGGDGFNARLTFTLNANVDYIVRTTSFWQYETGLYSLVINATSQAPVPPEQPQLPQFSDIYGYGLVDAAAAVAMAINADRFPDVPNWGGFNWANDMINAPEVWNQGYTGEGVVIAVVDTGVDYNHVDLRQNIWINPGETPGNGIDNDGNGFVDDIIGWNFVSNNNNPMDDGGHGTHVAGTAAAAHNSIGITGVAHNAAIMPVKVLDQNGSGTAQWVADGIRYAADNGAHVINLSLGSSGPSSLIEEAVRYATTLGAFVVMAAGNSSGSAPNYPARFATDYGVSVGAVGRDRQIADFSNRAGSDSQLHHLMAPGVGIYSTMPGNRYSSMNGTSMATPHVAGVVALMLNANPNLSHDQIRHILIQSGVSAESLDLPIEEQPLLDEEVVRVALSLSRRTLDMLPVVDESQDLILEQLSLLQEVNSILPSLVQSSPTFQLPRHVSYSTGSQADGSEDLLLGTWAAEALVQSLAG